jgi:hypothetical protein
MDSHGFSDPVPVTDAEIPTWEVEVIRIKGDVIVGQLTVNNKTLPPRKGGKAKAIVWKLPDDATQLPRFGEHEKKRLWELFKEQKKQRRRESKQQQQQSQQQQHRGSSNEPPGSDPSRVEENQPNRASQPNAASPDEDSDSEIIELEGPSASGSAMKKKKAKAKKTAHKNTNDSPSSCTEIPPREDEEELFVSATATLPEAGQTQSGTSPPLLAPPPGFFASVVDDSASPALNNKLSTFPAESSHCFLLYFTPDLLDTANYSSYLGQSVVQTFVDTVGSGTIDDWLAHYHPNAVKSLLVGTAQVTVRTNVERREQWDAMVVTRRRDQHETGTGGCTWDVTGWTSHECSGSSRNKSSDDDDNHSPCPVTVLVVLTGATQQATGRFAFTLSLVLSAAAAMVLENGGEKMMSTSTMTTTVTAAPPHRRYSITNDVLTLFKI